MIPRIRHSRSQLRSHLNEYENGAISLFVSSDTYPELFEMQFAVIVAKAPNGWRQKKMAYLWFPENALDEDEINSINEWREKFEQYVLLGLNQHIEDFFADELDFCMALDFNIDPAADRRTVYGEAEFQLKYRHSRAHFNVLKTALEDALDDLPIPQADRESVCLMTIPAPPDEQTIARQLAEGVAEASEIDFVDAVLHCPKDPLKGVSVDEKIPIWQDLYDNDCVELAADVNGRVVVIIDDLYQSGSTMWMFAKFLKEQGAKHVLGLACVKSLRDTDNQ
jgi:hypothetical protein